MSTTRTERWEKKQKRSSHKKRVEVRVRDVLNPDGREVVGIHVHKGRQLREGRFLQIPGLNGLLPIVAHRVLGGLTISVTVDAPRDDFMRLSRRKKWKLKDALPI